MATDTAFALGVLAVAGRRASQRLRAFILTVVIADDIGVLLVIAFAYTETVSLPALSLAALLFARSSSSDASTSAGRRCTRSSRSRSGSRRRSPASTRRSPASLWVSPSAHGRRSGRTWSR